MRNIDYYLLERESEVEAAADRGVSRFTLTEYRRASARERQSESAIILYESQTISGKARRSRDRLIDGIKDAWFDASRSRVGPVRRLTAAAELLARSVVAPVAALVVGARAIATVAGQWIAPTPEYKQLVSSLAHERQLSVERSKAIANICEKLTPAQYSITFTAASRIRELESNIEDALEAACSSLAERDDQARWTAPLVRALPPIGHASREGVLRELAIIAAARRELGITNKAVPLDATQLRSDVDPDDAREILDGAFGAVTKLLTNQTFGKATFYELNPRISRDPVFGPALPNEPNFVTDLRGDLGATTREVPTVTLAKTHISLEQSL